MKRFIEGEARSQITLLPECLDDHIAEDYPGRVVDVFVDELNLHQRRFKDGCAAVAAGGACAPNVRSAPRCSHSVFRLAGSGAAARPPLSAKRGPFVRGDWPAVNIRATRPAAMT
ncbi:hypothetical protein F9K07_28615 [Hydrogenophaga sp. BPS33]|nr:hypothetical protein F9K07_28615 [Hydrogenophaga sp. BPS33]